MSEIEYYETITKLGGGKIPQNACYYCESLEGPFSTWGSENFLKCQGGCE